jgi:hypothetical protein
MAGRSGDDGVGEVWADAGQASATAITASAIIRIIVPARRFHKRFWPEQW